MLPMTVSVAECRDRLSELMRLVESGETVEIARYNGAPTVRLVPVNPPRPIPLETGAPGTDWSEVDKPLEEASEETPL